MTSAKVTRWLSALLLVKIGLRARRKIARARSRCSQAPVTNPHGGSSWRVLVEFGAVADHGAFQVFAEQPQSLDQGMNGPQHRPGDIVGVHLIAAHHQQCRALAGFIGLRQQGIDTQQAVG
jgi:hypothetical protein